MNKDLNLHIKRVCMLSTKNGYRTTYMKAFPGLGVELGKPRPRSIKHPGGANESPPRRKGLLTSNFPVATTFVVG